MTSMTSQHNNVADVQWREEIYDAFFLASFAALSAATLCTNSPIAPNKPTPATPGMASASDRSGK